jgi:hypothetical protein
MPRSVWVWGSKKISACLTPAHQISEVALGDEHCGPLVVDVEEGLQIIKLVRGTHLLDRGKRQLDTILLGEREHQLRFECALDVDMQLGLGQTLYEVVQASLPSIGGSAGDFPTK